MVLKNCPIILCADKGLINMTEKQSGRRGEVAHIAKFTFNFHFMTYRDFSVWKSRIGKQRNSFCCKGSLTLESQIMTLHYIMFILYMLHSAYCILVSTYCVLVPVCTLFSKYYNLECAINSETATDTHKANLQIHTHTNALTWPISVNINLQRHKHPIIKI